MWWSFQYLVCSWIFSKYWLDIFMQVLLVQCQGYIVWDWGQMTHLHYFVYLLSIFETWCFFLCYIWLQIRVYIKVFQVLGPSAKYEAPLYIWISPQGQWTVRESKLNIRAVYLDVLQLLADRLGSQMATY